MFESQKVVRHCYTASPTWVCCSSVQLLLLPSMALTLGRKLRVPQSFWIWTKLLTFAVFFKTIYAFHKVSLRAMPFMIFYLLCVLCPLPASRIHLHRGCVLRARSQALCECHPIRHAARISTSYKGVNACSWLLLHHCAMRQIRQMMQIITFFWSESECLVRQNLAKLLIPLLGGVVIDHLGHLGSICDKASIFVQLMWHYIWYVFLNRMLYMMPLMQSGKPFAICRANCLVRCNLVMYLYSNS